MQGRTWCEALGFTRQSNNNTHGLVGQGIKNSEMSAADSAAFQEGGCTAVLIGTEDLYGALEQKFDGFVTGPLTVLRSVTVCLLGVAAQNVLCSSAYALLSGGGMGRWKRKLPYIAQQSCAAHACSCVS